MCFKFIAAAALKLHLHCLNFQQRMEMRSNYHLIELIRRRLVSSIHSLDLYLYQGCLRNPVRPRATHVVVDCCRCNYPLLLPYVNVSITSVASVRYERAANVWISASAAARGCATRRTSLNCQFARRCEDMSHFGMACQFGKKHARALTNWSIKLVGRRWRHTRPISLTLMINFHRES